MTGLVAPLLLALLAALAVGGSLRPWTSVRVHWWPAAVVAFGLLLLLYNPPLDREPWAIAWGPAFWVLTRLVFVAVLLRNATGSLRQRLPWQVAALGVALNAAVIVANGGYMPQSVDAAATTWGARSAEPAAVADRLRNVVPMGPETRLAWLGDVIPQPAWLPRANVVSVGDLLLSAGLAGWVFQVTAARRRHDAPHGDARDG